MVRVFSTPLPASAHTCDWLIHLNLNCRKRLSLGVNIRARGLSTVQDSTSQKFVLLGQLSRQDSTSEGRYVSLFLDFAPMGRRKCDENDFEKWYARTIKNKECLMGHRVCAYPIKDVKCALMGME